MTTENLDKLVGRKFTTETENVFEVIEVKTVIVLVNRGQTDKDGWNYNDRCEYKFEDFNSTFKEVISNDR